MAKSSSQLSSWADSGDLKRSVVFIEVGEGKVSIKGVLRTGIGAALSNLLLFRDVPVSGERNASFHSCTLLTASSYSVDFLGITESDRRALTIHGCFSNFLAETRKLGSFWKHCIRKSLTAWLKVSQYQPTSWNPVNKRISHDLPGKLLEEVVDGHHSQSGTTPA